MKTSITILIVLQSLGLIFLSKPALAQDAPVDPWPTMEVHENCLWKTVGDAECDEDVDEQDYQRWVCELIGEGRCQTSPMGPESWRSADFDLVDNVTINDFEIWRRHDITINPITPTPTVNPADCNCFPGNFPCCEDSFYDDRCSDPEVPPDSTCEICDTQCRDLGCCDLLTPTPVPTAGPVGYWKFDEGSGTTAADSSGNNNTGTLVNMDPASAWVTGKSNTALDFDGINNYVEIPYDSVFEIANTITVSTWIKRHATGTNRHIASRDHASTGVVWEFDTRSNDALRFEVSTDGQMSSARYCDSTQTLDTNWHHVVAVYDGTYVSLYIDGVLDKTAQMGSTGCDSGTLFSGDLPSSNQPLYVGVVDYGGNKEYYTGKIDEFRIYDYVLSAAEIEDQYNQQAALVAYWQFDEGSGLVTQDSSGNNNTGALTNMDPATDWVDGKIGKALDFDGDSATNQWDNVVISNESNFDFERTDPITVMAWINLYCANPLADPPVCNNSNVLGTIFGKVDTSRGANQNVGFEFEVQPQGRQLYVEIFYLSFDNKLRVVSPTNVIEYNTWHHVAYTYNGNSDVSGVKIYVDGVSQSTTGQYNDLTGSILSDYAPRIGSSNMLSSNFKGQIDELKVYDFVLTEQQINAQYNAN